jgi:hypothetical protein
MRKKHMEDKPALIISLADDELAALGRVVVVWNQIEQFLDTGVLAMLDVSTASMEKIMGSPHVPSKADIFEALATEKLTDAEVREEAIACAKRIKDLSNFRNDVIHGRWATAVPSGIEEARKKLSATPINIQQIRQKYGEICKLSHRMVAVVQRISLLHPFKPRPQTAPATA